MSPRYAESRSYRPAFPTAQRQFAGSRESADPMRHARRPDAESEPTPPATPCRCAVCRNRVTCVMTAHRVIPGRQSGVGGCLAADLAAILRFQYCKSPGLRRQLLSRGTSPQRFRKGKPAAGYPREGRHASSGIRPPMTMVILSSHGSGRWDVGD